MNDRMRQVEKYILDQTGKSVRVKRVMSDHLYSAAKVPAAAPVNSVFDFFAAGYGTTGQGFAVPLTERETNLPNQGALPRETSMLVWRVGVKIDESTLIKDAEDRLVCDHIISDFLNHAVLKIDQPDFKKTFGPVWMMPSCGGMSGYSVINNASIVGNGAGGYQGMYTLNQPLVLEAGGSVRFSIQLLGADGFAALTNTAPFTVWVDLVGDRVTQVVAG